MTAATTIRPVRLGILGSTKGTDLQSLIDAVHTGSLQAEIAVVLSDRSHAFILERVLQYGIPSHFIPVYTGPKGKKEKKDRIAYDRELSVMLRKYGVDLVLLIGYMRILSPEFCEHWKNRVVNVHPSLLPDFSGGMDTDVHTAVLNANKKETGCTVHLVTPELDAGPVILQKKCPVYENDTPETLKKRVQTLEGSALVDVVQDFQQNGYFSTLT
ncbi:MAG: phosphoribosylglycinamide formyltransferase [Spirochaetia bacterium]|nr:phosphoribosylglycinamide formyltransferase [Spirochaetia bacterium]